MFLGVKVYESGKIGSVSAVEKQSLTKNCK